MQGAVLRRGIVSRVSLTRPPLAPPLSQEVVPLPKTALDEREDADVLSDEDIEFVASHAKSLGFLTKMKSKQLDA